MKTVTLYWVSPVDYSNTVDGSGYSLEPWSQPTTDGMIDARSVHNEDDGGKEYYLPEDGATYEVAEANCGGTYIWRNGERCDIIKHGSGLPQLVSSARSMPVLKPVAA